MAASPGHDVANPVPPPEPKATPPPPVQARALAPAPDANAHLHSPVSEAGSQFGSPEREAGSQFGPPVPDAEPEAPIERRRRPLVVVALGLVAVVIVAIVAVVTGLGGDGGSETVAEADAVPTTSRPATTTVDDLSPAAAFTRASQRLETSGSFAYSGTSSATDVSPVRPGVWLAVELTVVGEVDLGSGRLHEIGSASSGRVSETVTDGLQVWGRLADDEDDLATEPYLPVGDRRAAPRRFGAALLPTWLAASVDPEELPTGPAGYRSFRATIPAEVVGEIEDDRAPVPAEVVLTLDEAGEPVHVEVSSAPEGPRLRLVFDIGRLGEPAPITVPGKPAA